MKTYNCKNEELPVIAGYLHSSLKRDLADFTAFSPKFDGTYVATFEGKIVAVTEVLNPRTETVELKAVTERLYKRMDSLLDPIARVEKYVKIAGSEIPVSIKDFGFSQLRLKIKTKDAEGMLAVLKTVNNYLDTYKSALMAQGLSDELIAVFSSSSAAVHNDNQLQYEIVTNRKKLVDSNAHLLNELYGYISEICDTGKVVYRGNAVAMKEYTFTELKKRVRIVHKIHDEKSSSNE